MPHVSAQELEPRLNDTLTRLLGAFFGFESPKKEMFNLMITDTEQLMWAKRLSALLLLHKGVKQARIARALRMTRITVARLKKVYEAEKGLVTEISRVLSSSTSYQTLVMLVK